MLGLFPSAVFSFQNIAAVERQRKAKCKCKLVFVSYCFYHVSKLFLCYANVKNIVENLVFRYFLLSLHKGNVFIANDKTIMGKRTRRKIINEVVDINGSKVFVENGEVKIIYNEEIQRTGYMSVEESRDMTLAAIEKVYALQSKKS